MNKVFSDAISCMDAMADFLVNKKFYPLKGGGRRM